MISPTFLNGRRNMRGGKLITPRYVTAGEEVRLFLDATERLPPRSDPGERYHVGAQLGDADVFHGLKQARLMVEQQEGRVVNIDQGLAAAARKNMCHFMILSSK